MNSDHIVMAQAKRCYRLLPETEKPVYTLEDLFQEGKIQELICRKTYRARLDSFCSFSTYLTRCLQTRYMNLVRHTRAKKKGGGEIKFMPYNEDCCMGGDGSPEKKLILKSFLDYYREKLPLQYKDIRVQLEDFSGLNQKKLLTVLHFWVILGDENQLYKHFNEMEGLKWRKRKR